MRIPRDLVGRILPTEWTAFGFDELENGDREDLLHVLRAGLVQRKDDPAYRDKFLDLLKGVACDLRLDAAREKARAFLRQLREKGPPVTIDAMGSSSPAEPSLMPAEGLTSGIEKAKARFKESRYPFPYVPPELAAQLRELSEWCFSTRPIRVSPYRMEAFVKEAHVGVVGDYAILAFDGHGVNSYALHYFLRWGPLDLFIQIGCGGVYCDSKKDRRIIAKCYALAESLVQSLERVRGPGMTWEQWMGLAGGNSLTVVVSNLWGSYWVSPDHPRARGKSVSSSQSDPVTVLAEALAWATGRWKEIASLQAHSPKAPGSPNTAKGPSLFRE